MDTVIGVFWGRFGFPRVLVFACLFEWTHICLFQINVNNFATFNSSQNYKIQWIFYYLTFITWLSRAVADLSCEANMGNAQHQRSHVALWAWEQREQITIIISSRASRTAELTNPGTWGKSKCVLPDREMSDAKKKKQKTASTTFQLAALPAEKLGSAAQTEEQKVGAFGLTSCTLINWLWDLKSTYQRRTKDADESMFLLCLQQAPLTGLFSLALWGEKSTC